MAPHEEQTETSESSQKEEKKQKQLNNLLYYTENLAFEYFILV